MINPQSSGGLSVWNYNVEADTIRRRSSCADSCTPIGLYRPGEKVHQGASPASCRPLAAPPTGPVAVEVGPMGRMHTAEAPEQFGGFWFDLDLPGPRGWATGRRARPAAHQHLLGRYRARRSWRQVGNRAGGAPGKSTRRCRRITLRRAAARGHVAVAISRPPGRVSQHQDYTFDRRPGRPLGRRLLATQRDHVGSTARATRRSRSRSAERPGGRCRSAGPRERDVTGGRVIIKTFTILYYRSKRYFDQVPGWRSRSTSRRSSVIGVGPDGAVANGSAKLRGRHDWNCVWEDWGYRGSSTERDQGEGTERELAWPAASGG
jgi:hypothetical protein